VAASSAPARGSRMPRRRTPAPRGRRPRRSLRRSLARKAARGSPACRALRQISEKYPMYQVQYHRGHRARERQRVRAQRLGLVGGRGQGRGDGQRAAGRLDLHQLARRVSGRAVRRLSLPLSRAGSAGSSPRAISTPSPVKAWISRPRPSRSSCPSPNCSRRAGGPVRSDGRRRCDAEGCAKL
jgi:hypothetical protein